MTTPRLAAAIVVLVAPFAFAITSPAAHAAEVKVEADLGQSVLHADRTDRVYLRLGLKSIAARKSERRTPVNVALVLDRSGSMSGERIAAAKEAADMAIDRLGSDDIVALVAYNHNVSVLQPAARLSSPSRLKAEIDELRADGTTALYAGVVEGGREVKTFLSDTKVNRVILLSDGLANVGPSTPRELGELGRELGSQGISVTTIGLGLDYNEDLMQRLAAASDGNHAFAETPRDLIRIFDAEFGDVLSVDAKDITITIECKLGFRPIRILGRDGEISGNRITLKLNQLQGGNDRYVVVELEAPKGTSAGTAEIAGIGVDYLDLESSKRARAEAKVEARISASEAEAEASVNKAVLAQVAAQIATETSEKAVELRDKGDLTGARKMLEDNAAYLNRSRGLYASGAGAAPAPSVQALDELERKSREAANNLDEGNWEKTRKSMRYDQHKSKVQQSY